MSTLTLTGVFADKTHFTHVIQVPTARLTGNNAARILGFEFLMHQYSGSKVATIKSFTATVA